MHLHIGSVQGADGQGSVHHELHIACAAGLLAGGGDLLGQLAGWHELLRQGDPVVLQENHLELILADGVPVDLGGQGVDELDDLFGHMIAGGGLGPEEEGLGREVHVGIVPQLLVQAHDMQHVEQLALILVQALHLYVEDGVGVEDDPGLPGHIAGKTALVLPFDGLQAVQDGGVVLVDFSRPEMDSGWSK